jgi:tetratricopeptide (TPR) repeat protein
LVAAVVLAASVSGLGNGFAYDDINAVAQNERIHSLADPGRFFTETYWPPGKFVGGSTLYRPLSSLGFALQWAAGGGQATLFHFTNVALYLLVCLAFLWVGRAFLPPLGALIAALLYAAHPVHVEAVGNVVGQGELWVNLFSLLAVGSFLYGRNSAGLDHSTRLVIYSCYALACLAKDNGLMLPGLLLAAELTVVRDPRPLRVRLVALRTFWGVVAGVGVVYLVLRTKVTGTLAGDYPHILIGTATYPERLFTMLRVALEWPRLLLWPAHLQADYSPRDFERALAFGPAQAAGLGLLLSAAWLTVWSWRRRPAVALGMLWFAVAIFPVSNLVLKAGVVLAERTLFLPSAGVMLAVGAGFGALLEAGVGYRRLALGGGGVLVLLGAWRSAVRQPVWRDSATLSAQTVRDAPQNYRAHWTYALNLYEHGQREMAFTQMATAMVLYPYDPNMFSDAGDLYRTDGQCERSLDFYQRALDLIPDLIYTRSRLASCYMRLGRYPEARRELHRLVAEGHPEFGTLILSVDSAAAAAHTFR